MKNWKVKIKQISKTVFKWKAKGRSRKIKGKAFKEEGYPVLFEYNLKKGRDHWVEEEDSSEIESIVKSKIK